MLNEGCVCGSDEDEIFEHYHRDQWTSSKAELETEEHLTPNQKARRRKQMRSSL